MTPRTKIISALSAAIVLAAAGGWWKLSHKAAAVSYDTAPITRGRIVAKVSASGTASALVTVQVGSQVSGRIAEINVDFNSTVKKGMVLAKIDPQLFQAAVEQARANLAAADGNLEKAKVQALDAKRQVDRAKTLVEQKLIAQADFDTAEATADAATAGVRSSEGSVAQARASLSLAQTNLAYATITSPINGTVISRNVDVGQTVASALSAPTLFTIAEDLGKMQVDTSVAEADVGKLSSGMPASFFVDAFPAERFKGVVRQIRNAPTTTQNVVTYDAVIDVLNPELKLKPGMTATVTFVYAEKDDVLELPNAALRFRPPADMLPKDASGKTGGGGGGHGGGRGNGDGSHGNGGGGRPVAANETHSDARSDATSPVLTQTSGATAAVAADGSKRHGGGGGGYEPRPANERDVWILDGTTLKSITVTTGVTDGTNTEIVSGALTENQNVVTAVGTPGSAKAGAAGGPPGGMRRMF